MCNMMKNLFDKWEKEKKKVQQTTFLCQTQKLLSILISFKMFLVNTFLFFPAKLSALIFTEVPVLNIFSYRSTEKQVLFFIHENCRVPFPVVVTVVRQPELAKVHPHNFHFNSVQYSCLFPKLNCCTLWLS